MLMESQRVEAPVKLSKTDFEALIVHHFKWCKENRIAHAGRYGVQGVFTKGGFGKEHGGEQQGGRGQWSPMRSLPDFEGVTMPIGRQFITDAKVCSGASFPVMDETHASKRQLEHLLDRAEFGSICFFIVHWNARELKTKSEPAWTCAIPVHRELPLWKDLLSAERRSISRKEAELYGFEIRWMIPPRARKEVPDVLSWVRWASKRIPEFALIKGE